MRLVALSKNLKYVDTEAVKVQREIKIWRHMRINFIPYYSTRQTGMSHYFRCGIITIGRGRAASNPYIVHPLFFILMLLDKIILEKYLHTNNRNFVPCISHHSHMDELNHISTTCNFHNYISVYKYLSSKIKKKIKNKITALPS